MMSLVTSRKCAFQKATMAASGGRWFGDLHGDRLAGWLASGADKGRNLKLDFLAIQDSMGSLPLEVSEHVDI
jgi:hypothetical protein